MSEVMKVKNGNGNSQQHQMSHKDTEKYLLDLAFWKSLFYRAGSFEYVKTDCWGLSSWREHMKVEREVQAIGRNLLRSRIAMR